MSEALFEKATRTAVRFDSPKGALSVEDLWDLPLQTTRPNGASLDQIAIALDRQLKDSATVSFVDESTKSDELLQLKFDLAKYIIGVKKAENAAAAAAREKAATKQRILEIIAKKQDHALENASIEELEQKLASL
jgi:hypothetical protein